MAFPHTKHLRLTGVARGHMEKVEPIRAINHGAQVKSPESLVLKRQHLSVDMVPACCLKRLCDLGGTKWVKQLSFF